MLPAGLTIDTNGLISGTPGESGEHHFTIRQTVGSTSVWRSYRIFSSGVGTINGTPRDAEENFAYERDKSAIVMLSNRLDAGFDSRTIQTNFAPGTPLIDTSILARSSIAAMSRRFLFKR